MQRKRSPTRTHHPSSGDKARQDSPAIQEGLVGDVLAHRAERNEMGFNAFPKKPLPESMTRFPRLQQELDQAASTQDIPPAVPVTDTWLQTG